MRKISALAAALAAIGAAAPASAVEESRFLRRSAADLGALCSARTGEPRALEAMHDMCQGYLAGLHHFHEATARADGASALYCIRDATAPTRQEAAADFAAWIAESPQAAELPAVEGAVRWAAARFPCE
jgi:hypothetical protein